MRPLESALFAGGAGMTVSMYLATDGIKNQNLREIDIETGQQRTGEWRDYRNIRFTGLVGGIQPFSDGQVELFSYPDGQLVFRKGGASIESGITLPAHLRYAEDDYVFACVLTPRLVVLKSRLNSPEHEGPIGRKTLLIGRLIDSSGIGTNGRFRGTCPNRDGGADGWV
ncbi:MAG: hypothetical protein U0R19_02275 [Bryobacteraceae bacterium]